MERFGDSYSLYIPYLFHIQSYTYIYAYIHCIFPICSLCIPYSMGPRLELLRVSQQSNMLLTHVETEHVFLLDTSYAGLRKYGSAD